jgi:transcriptional regulator with XRE-family HTH domain
MIDVYGLEDMLGKRIALLRMAKGVSAREMSLSIGQSNSYINHIETKRVMPSMRGFFYICEYLNISPKDFFDDAAEEPEKLNEIIRDLKSLNSKQLANIGELVKGLKR